MWIASGQTRGAYREKGTGPALIFGDGALMDRFTDSYRVVLPDAFQGAAESFTADRWCADILAIADAAGVERFAWYGFSFGAVVGLQLAARTDRLSALICGGWPPLGGQYRETLAVTEAAQGPGEQFATFYRSLQGWPEREAVSRLSCPRFAFAGSQDEFVAGGHAMRIGPLLAEHRNELEGMGWTVRLVEGFGHELGARPDIVGPLVREFLDPVLL